MDKINYSLWQYVSMVNPFVSKKDIKVLKYVSDYDILIIFNDNRKYIYDTFTGYHRYLKYTNSNLSKEEWEFEFRRRLQELLQRKCISQEELAKRIETKQQVISRYLTGERVPVAYMMNKIIDALDCTIYDIMFIPILLKKIYEEEKYV